MSKFQLPQLPASCFGICVNVIEEEFEGRIEKFDLNTHWFKENRKPRKYTSVNKRKGLNRDTLRAGISDAAPGSRERIEALAAFYASNMPQYDSHERAKMNGQFIDDNDCVSPFDQTIEETADLMAAIVCGAERKLAGDKVFSKSRKPMNTNNMD